MYNLVFKYWLYWSKQFFFCQIQSPDIKSGSVLYLYFCKHTKCPLWVKWKWCRSMTIQIHKPGYELTYSLHLRLWMWRIRMGTHCGRKWKQNEFRTGSGRASLYNNPHVTLDQKTAKAKEGRSQAGDWLVGWSQQCNDTNILVSRSSLSGSPLSTLKVITHLLSIMEMNLQELVVLTPETLNLEAFCSLWFNTTLWRYFQP